MAKSYGTKSGHKTCMGRTETEYAGLRIYVRKRYPQ